MTRAARENGDPVTTRGTDDAGAGARPGPARPASVPPAHAGTVRRAAVLGHPIEHSRSPLLHLAAYRALGLVGWQYDRIDCTADRLPGLVDSLGPEWVGLSVTMPGKFAALAHATERTPRAETIGSANTLVRVESGWRADCTDVDGVSGAVRAAGVDVTGRPVVVVGAGGTSRPAIVALADSGASGATLVVRDVGRAADAVECARGIGLPIEVVLFDDAAVARRCADAGVLVSTVPAAGAAPFVDALAQAPVVLDAIYDPWPTPLARAVGERGGTVISGLQMLLHQAFGQVEQFTGRPAPRAEMADALTHA